MNRYSCLLALMPVLLVGCASQETLYDWGSYEDNLFNYYHKPATKNAVIADHLEFLEELELEGKKPAPGLLAEAGTLLLMNGDAEGAITFYQKEHGAWPESQAMMSSLISNLEERAHE